MEDGSIDLARRLADQCTGRDFIRPGFRESSGSRKFGDYRRGNRGLSYLDRHAGVSAAVSFMASLTHAGPWGGLCASYQRGFFRRSAITG